MSTGAAVPAPYEVSYSQRVRKRLLELADAAHVRGDGRAFTSAVREFDRRLRLYPQFGDPLCDLRHQVGHIRLRVVPPLAMRYGVLEEARQVLVDALPVLLSRSAIPGDG